MFASKKQAKRFSETEARELLDSSRELRSSKPTVLYQLEDSKQPKAILRQPIAD
jgi:hypothetical protein